MITDRLEAERDSIRGIIVTSAKKTFFAGGDLRDPDPGHARDRTGAVRRRPRHQAGTCAASRPSASPSSPRSTARPSAAASNWPSPATTGGPRHPGTKIGCPEVTLGLLPGGGGVVRTVRLLGIADALLKVLLQGQQYNARRAQENGLVHEVAATPEELLAKARAFIDAHPESQQPWDKPGYKIPGGTPPTRSSPRTCPRSRPTCASRPTAPPTRRRATSSPPPSRAPRSTSRRPRSSRPATSWNWPRARPRRT